MIELNLITSCEEHELIKAYLQENVSETLAEKINNGVRIEKDGKILISKKNLDGFMSYAQDEARKIAEKGKNFKAVHHTVVFGWAVHYFEEDSIEGTLYNEDGTEYKPIPKAKPSAPQHKPQITPKKKPESQFSLFDLMDNEKPVETANNEPKRDFEEPTTEENDKPFKYESEKTENIQSPLYRKYLQMEKMHPNHIVIYRLGDFYEVFGENAVSVGEWANLTITGRDFGLEKRIPMVGFPYHCAENYFNKILEYSPIAIIEDGKSTLREKEQKPTNIDIETGEIFDLTEEEMRQFDGDIYEPNELVKEETKMMDEIKRRINKDAMYMLYSLLDGKLEIV